MATMTLGSNTITTNGDLVVRSNLTLYNQVKFRGMQILPYQTPQNTNLTANISMVPGYSNSNNSITLSIGTGTNYFNVNNGGNDVFKVTGAGVVTASNIALSNRTVSNVTTTGVTGTGNLVLSTAPTFTGTVTSCSRFIHSNIATVYT